MRKLLAFFLAASLIFVFAGCNAPETPETPTATQAPTQATAPVATQPAQQLGQKDSYWVAKTWESEDTAECDGPQPFASSWEIDLLVRADGTARLRDIREQVCIMDDSHLQLIWQADDDGHYLFYNHLGPRPVLDAVFDGETLTATYRDMQLTLEAAPVPQTVGETYSPAELAGTWLLVSGETEGTTWDAMPTELSSIVLQVTSEDGPLLLAADLTSRDRYGDTDMAPLYNQKVELLQEPLYQGCENEKWSVRIGPESPKKANNAPENTEYYATLLSYYTLQLQQYYELDGLPAVSYQTYVRFPDLVSWCSAESMELLNSNWICIGYTDFDRQPLTMPAELEGMEVLLGESDCCTVTFGDGTIADGTWHLKDDGVILLRSEEEESTEFWLGGAVNQFCLEFEDDLIEKNHMDLYYKGGILQLELTSYG